MGTKKMGGCGVVVMLIVFLITVGWISSNDPAWVMPAVLGVLVLIWLWRRFTRPLAKPTEQWKSHKQAREERLRDSTSDGFDDQGRELNWKHFYTKAYGVTKANPDGRDRQRIISKCRINEPLQLVREPHNKHDENAIAIWRSNGDQIGYINTDTAEWMARMMDDGQRFKAHISDLTGGPRENRDRGVNIEINAV